MLPNTELVDAMTS